MSLYVNVVGLDAGNDRQHSFPSKGLLVVKHEL